MRYPQELNTGEADCVTFTHFKYQNNSGTGRAGKAPPPSGRAAIQLYMPASTPSMGNSNDWGDAKFEGPLGALKRDIGTFAGDAVVEADISNFDTATKSAQGSVDQFKKQFVNKGTMGRVGNAGKQFAIDAMAGPLGFSDASQLLALSRGEIYNPNVELLYKGPKLRQFNFTYQFVPKSPQEAAIVNQIIKEFKMFSAPLDKGMMYEVPHLWQVTYMYGGKENKKMNTFKRAACTKVSLQANNGMSMHASFVDGQPITYTMGLSFNEVDIITRKDHEEAGEVGF